MHGLGWYSSDVEAGQCHVSKSQLDKKLKWQIKENLRANKNRPHISTPARSLSLQQRCPLAIWTLLNFDEAASTKFNKLDPSFFPLWQRSVVHEEDFRTGLMSVLARPLVARSNLWRASTLATTRLSFPLQSDPLFIISKF